MAAVTVLMIVCTACTPIASINDEAYTAFHEPELSNYEIVYPVSNKAIEMGKKLLQEYEVGFDEVIRFVCDDKHYEAIGAEAITSIKEARKKYPNLSIPKKLGKYKFVDLTVDHSRMREVGENEVPKPSDKIEVLENIQHPPKQFYMCYRNGISQFRVNLLPINIKEVREAYDISILTFDEWGLHKDAYLQGEISEDDGKLYISNLFISPEENGELAFWVQKVSNADCLQSSVIDFSEDEASYIYDAIRKKF